MNHPTSIRVILEKEDHSLVPVAVTEFYQIAGRKIVGSLDPLPDSKLGHAIADRIACHTGNSIRQHVVDLSTGTIRYRQMGEVAIASDGERSAIGTTEETARDAVKEMRVAANLDPTEDQDVSFLLIGSQGISKREFYRRVVGDFQRDQMVNKESRKVMSSGGIVVILPDNATKDAMVAAVSRISHHLGKAIGKESRVKK